MHELWTRYQKLGSWGVPGRWRDKFQARMPGMLARSVMSEMRATMDAFPYIVQGLGRYGIGVKGRLTLVEVQESQSS